MVSRLSFFYARALESCGSYTSKHVEPKPLTGGARVASLLILADLWLPSPLLELFLCPKTNATLESLPLKANNP